MCLNCAAKVSNVCYNIVKQMFHLRYKSASRKTAWDRSTRLTPLYYTQPQACRRPPRRQHHCKRWRFTRRKATFYRTKDGLLDGERPSFVNRLDINTLQNHRRMRTRQPCQVCPSRKNKTPRNAAPRHATCILTATNEKTRAETCIIHRFY